MFRNYYGIINDALVLLLIVLVTHEESKEDIHGQTLHFGLIRVL